MRPFVRLVLAAIALIGGLYVAAHYPDLAWVGVAGMAVSYLLAPGGKKKKTKGHS